MIQALPTSLLDRYPAAARPISTPMPLGNAGGFSGARLWRFDSPRGPLVARAWPVDGPDEVALARIHGWIAEAAGVGFLPVPVETLGGRTLVTLDGRTWEVAPWMPGQADLSRPPRPSRIRAAFSGLAAFHSRFMMGRFLARSPGLLARIEQVEDSLSGGLAAISRAIDRARGDPVADLARRWVSRATVLAPGVLPLLRRASSRDLWLQPCLRDARPDHFLFDGDRLSGLVDFGAMGIEAVAADLARLLGEAIGADRDGRAEALTAYEAIRPLSGGEMDALDAFLRANALLGAGRWARWHFLEHRVFEDPQAISKGLRRGLQRMDECFGT